MTAASVLVVAPHALDEVLGCAGTIARLGDCGIPVHVLVLFGDGTGHDAKRRAAAAEAGRILGIAGLSFAGLPENRGDTIPLTQVVGAVETVVAGLRPHAVYAAHGGNLHIDHQTAFRATATALRPLPGQPVAAFYGYEVPSSTDWEPIGAGQPFQPVRYVGIENTLERKRRALEAYGFELRPEPHARSLPAVLNLARMRGATVGLPAAEAFTVLREIVSSERAL